MISLGYPECEKSRRDQTITLKDRTGGNSRYIGSNPGAKLIMQIEIDGCVINDQDKRKCDYLILNCDDNVSYFIELKGSNISDAYKQIAETYFELNKIAQFRTNVIDEHFKMMARVVLAKGNVPRIIPSSYRKLVKILEQVNGEKVKNGIHIKRIKSGQPEIL